MAMDGDRLGDAMKAAIDAAISGVSAANLDRTALWRAIGSAIVAEITGHAAVTAAGTDPQGGVVNSTGTVS